jgi:hypothetical protein
MSPHNGPAPSYGRTFFRVCASTGTEARASCESAPTMIAVAAASSPCPAGPEVAVFGC